MQEFSMYSFKNIYDAYISCRKNKRNTINQLEFEADLDLISRHSELEKSSLSA